MHFVDLRHFHKLNLYNQPLLSVKSTLVSGFMLKTLRKISDSCILLKVNVFDEHICVTEIEKVSSCPVTEQEHNEAARRKMLLNKIDMYKSDGST